MAKTATSTDLFERLRDSGLRKRTAKQISKAIDSSNKRAPKQVRRVVNELREVVSEVEDRAMGGPAKRKLSANKAAATRKRNAHKRSAAAKKAAATRKKARR
jgi:hypothetical protein